MNTPTPEEIAAAQAVIDSANAAEKKKRDDAIREVLGPLIAVGLGTDQPLTVSVSELSSLMRATASSVAQLDASVSNLMFSLSGPMTTLNDSISRLWPQDEDPAPPAEEPDAPDE